MSNQNELLPESVKLPVETSLEPDPNLGKAAVDFEKIGERAKADSQRFGQETLATENCDSKNNLMNTKSVSEKREAWKTSCSCNRHVMSRVHQENFSKFANSTGACDMPYERSSWTYRWDMEQDGPVVKGS